MKRRGVNDQALLWMMLPGLFWAGNAIVGRAVAGEVPPIALAFWRWTAGAIIVLPLAYRYLQQDLRQMLRAWPTMLILSALGVAVFNTFLYRAAHTTTALNIVMLQSTGPVLIVVATFVLFSEMVNARQAVGITVSLVGALILVTHGRPLMLMRLDLNSGDVWMLAAVASYAVYTALLRRRPSVHGLSFLVATFVLGALILLPFYLAETFSGHPLPMTLTSALSISYAAIFASVLAYFSFNRAVALIGGNTAGLAIHLVPVFGTVLAFFLLGEVPSLYHGVGIALIGFGIWLATRRGGSRRFASGRQHPDLAQEARQQS
jgi:drug/metabolite transporter (DMT)-like permease